MTDELTKPPFCHHLIHFAILAIILSVLVIFGSAYSFKKARTTKRDDSKCLKNKIQINSFLFSQILFLLS